MEQKIKCKLITTATDLTNHGFLQLKRSLDHFGWDYDVISDNYVAYGSKMLNAYNYAKNTDCTHLFIVDAYDVFILGTTEEALDRITDKDIILFNSEKACWPHPDKAGLYSETVSPWKYLNGGCAFVSVPLFVKMFEENPIKDSDNDQVNLTDIFISKKYNFQLDTACDLFQSIAFENELDFGMSINSKFVNLVNLTYPIIIHGNGGADMSNTYKYLPVNETLKSAISLWTDTPQAHKYLNESFIEKVNSTPKLKEYRDWIENNIFGFGERSFLWMWKLLIDESPKELSFLEIGVFRGQILGLIQILNPKAKVTGISPMTSEGGYWEGDYEADVKHLHDTFNLKQPKIIKGLSTDTEIIEQVKNEQFNIIYIDGGHTYDICRSDIINYSPLVKVGGYLVIDDCCHKYNLPDGYFKGHEQVSQAVDSLLPNDMFQEIFSIVHNRVFQRVS